MNKDNVLFATVGILLGFIAGYLMHEVMEARQPARRLAGDVTQAGGAPGMGAPGAPDAGGIGGTGGMGAGGADASGAGGMAPMAQIQQLRDYVEKNPNDADAVLSLANMNHQIQNWPRARELYEQYLRLRPGDPDVLSDLGVTLHKMGQNDAAIEQFHKAQTTAPDHWRSLYNEVVVLTFGMQRYDAAAEVAAKLKKMQPDNPDVDRLAAEVEKRRKA